MNHHSTAYGSIAGVVAAVPAGVITNADCPDPAAADEAAKITGVRERRWVREGQTALDLNLAAARRLLERMGWDPASLDLIVYVSQTPSRAVPADVYSLAGALGATCPCLQVNWSCAGYVYGLWTAMRILAPGGRALLLAGDANSLISDPGDRATAPLFGDAGTATAIDQLDELDPRSWPASRFVLGTDGAGAEKLCQRGHWLHMDGAAVFNFTLKHVPPLADAVRAHGEPDAWLLHQANAFMLDNLARKAKLGTIPRNIERFGNTSCASIPLLIADPQAGVTFRDGGRVGMLGYGAGWAWAGASIQTQALQVQELIEVGP